MSKDSQQAVAHYALPRTAPSGLQLTCAGNPPQLSIGGPPMRRNRPRDQTASARVALSAPYALGPAIHLLMLGFHTVPDSHRRPVRIPVSGPPSQMTSSRCALAPTPSTRYDTNVCGMVEPRSFRLDVCRPAHSRSCSCCLYQPRTSPAGTRACNW